MQFPEYSCQLACERKSGNQLQKGRYGEWLALHQILAGKICYTFMHAWNHYYTVNAASSAGIMSKRVSRIYIQLKLLKFMNLHTT